MSKTDSEMAGRPPESPAAFLALMASGVFWGLIWIPLKFVGELGLTGHTISLSAYVLLAALSLPVLLRQRHLWRSEWRLLLVIGLFFGCANIAFTSALMLGPVVRAMLLFYLLPAWGAIGGKLFLNERLGWRRLLAVGLSLGGVAVILAAADAWRAPLSLADAMALAAGLCYTAAGIANRKALAIPLASRTLVTFVGSAVLAGLGLLFLTPAMPQLSTVHWLLLAVFALLWLLGGSLMTTYGVTHVEASRAAVLQVVELLVAVVSAVLLGGEVLRLQEWIGGAMIVGATVLEARSAQ